MNNFSVYMHKNKINGKVYIGITKQNPEKRWGKGKLYHHNKHFTNAINKYGWDNFDHIILETDLSEELACEKEQYYISKYNSCDRKYGYNKAIGGHYATTSSKEERSIYTKKRYKEHPEQFKKFLDASKEKLQSEDGRKQKSDYMHNYFTEHPETKISISKKLGKKVNQYSLDGEYINTYDSAREVSRLFNITKSTINYTLIRSKTHIANGYIWKYSEQCE